MLKYVVEETQKSKSICRSEENTTATTKEKVRGKRFQKNLITIFCQSNWSFNIPPWAYPQAFDTFSCLGEGEFDHLSLPGCTNHRGWRIWSIASTSCYVSPLQTKDRRPISLLNVDEKISFESHRRKNQIATAGINTS